MVELGSFVYGVLYECLECEVLQKANYINTLTYLPTYLCIAAFMSLQLNTLYTHTHKAIFLDYLNSCLETWRLLKQNFCNLLMCFKTLKAM